MKYIVILGLLLASCSIAGRDRAPGRPIVVSVGPVPEGNWIEVSWVVGDEEDLARYDIYRWAEGEAVPDAIGRLEVIWAPGDTVSYYDKDVRLKVNYLYYIKAVDSRGNESTPSDTLEYSLLPKFVPQSPSGRTEDRPTFSFGHPGDPEVAYFRVVVEDAWGRRVWESPWQDATPLFGEGVGQVRYNYDGGAVCDPLKPGRYRWRVDASGEDPEREGSESMWMKFEVSF